MKEFKLNGTDVRFWYEEGNLWCKVLDMGADIYCCGNRPMPTTDEEALNLTKIAWLW